MIKFTEIIHESLQDIDVQKITAQEVLTKEVLSSLIFAGKDDFDEYVKNKLAHALGQRLAEYLPINKKKISHRMPHMDYDEIRYRVDCIVFKDFNELKRFAVALIDNYLTWGGKILKEE